VAGVAARASESAATHAFRIAFGVMVDLLGSDRAGPLIARSTIRD
jgi:hypothetical protein